MKADIPILGANNPTNQVTKLLSASLFAEEASKILENELEFAKSQRVYELRKSCGVETKGTF